MLGLAVAMLVLLFAAAIRAEVKQDAIVRDAVDVIELNYFDNEGKPVFDQWIFWEWLPDHGAFRVGAWRMAKRGTRPEQVRAGVTLTIFDGGNVRRIHGQQFRETWTQHDPEVEDRDSLATHMRRGLARTK